MTVEEIIRKKLTEAFSPETLEVVDESELHRGHGGWREGGQTHFRVTMISDRFSGLGRVARHRLVNAALAPELSAPDGIHALALDLRAPGI